MEEIRDKREDIRKKGGERRERERREKTEAIREKRGEITQNYQRKSKKLEA